MSFLHNLIFFFSPWSKWKSPVTELHTHSPWMCVEELTVYCDHYEYGVTAWLSLAGTHMCARTHTQCAHWFITMQQRARFYPPSWLWFLRNLNPPVCEQTGLQTSMYCRRSPPTPQPPPHLSLPPPSLLSPFTPCKFYADCSSVLTAHFRESLVKMAIS